MYILINHYTQQRRIGATPVATSWWWKPSNLLKNIFNDDEKSENSSLANEKSLEDNKQKKSIIKKNKPVKKTAKKVLPMLRLNKIIKFENSKYLLLHKIKNSDLKIIKMKSPNLWLLLANVENMNLK